MADFFKNDYRVVGTYNKNAVRIPGVLAIPCDALQKDEVQLVLYAFKPDITIYCCGISSIFDAGMNENLADALNTNGLFNVVEMCQRYKSQICYLSSSFVFAGENKKYIEMDIPDPTTICGKSQASAEFYIQKTSLNYILFRCCRLYGRNYTTPRYSWFELLQQKIFERKNFSVDNLLSAGYMDIYYLGMVLKMAFEKKVSNRLFQVSSTDTVTMYEFAKNYCEVFGESMDYVSKGKWVFPILSNATSAPGGILTFKMDVSNIEGFLNINLPTVRESLELTFHRLNGVKKVAGGKVRTTGVPFI